MRHPLFAKIAALAAVTLLLLFGLGLIEDVVRDRQRYRAEATRSVAQSLAGPQTLLGPMLHSACVESWDVVSGSGAERHTTEQRREFLLTALPEQLQLRTGAAMEERARGLHKVNAYTLKAHVTAQWASLASLRPEGTVKGSRMQCGAPILMVGVGDARGIRTAQVEVDGQALALKPGTFHPVYARGLHTPLPEALRGQDGPVSASLDLELVGTERLAIVPLGGTTEVQMQSGWPHPSFGGRFLPSERQVTGAGFTARWRLSSLATTAQQDVAESRKICDSAPADSLSYDAGESGGKGQGPGGCTDSFSVGFIDPVNPYSLSDRATKYGVLFIALTFVAVGLFELMGNGPHAPPLRGSLPPEGAAFLSGGGPAMKKLRVHPVQYLLVGSALCSFFLLLVSLSEHLPFGASYAIAATACVLLLGYYASHMLGSLRRGVPFGALIGLLYGLLYVLLQLEQTALVVGALSLFTVLAAVMVLTRRVNWYGLSPARPAQAAPEAA
ncbi:cell envelope integrity protein CreD [Paenacidovorax monticola]|uniref:Cell envelope integrity protein CreD n=1 Tax=Paenacidovorax monticola TaxID=1926868 RepID=A0A7H0HCP3_9BURK|nr:cell envelope integrity protein CreD [Paenacidovorax monticola]QNP58309.1 cell envelope integrity protein CreD [Paenacidovorax monticola]